MEQTTNYGLNQWNGEDRILREDFNADNAKLEQALAAQAEAQSGMQAALAGCGNCKVVYGTYTGSGKYGSSNKNTLTFDHKPIMVFVQPRDYVSNTKDYALRMVRGSTWSNGVCENYYFSQTVSWTDTTVAWYSTSGANADCQFNTSSTVYCYVAILAADE